MSYILEALKKAQAERQLGSSPTLHAPTLQSADRSSGGGSFKKPLVLVIIAMAVVIAALVAMVLRSSRAPAEAPALQVAAGAPAPAAQPALASPADAEHTPAAATPAPAASAPPADAAQARNQAGATAPLPAPVAALPPPVATITPASRKHAEPQAGQAAAPSTLPTLAGQAGQPAQTTPSPQAGQMAPTAASASAGRTMATSGAPAKPAAFEEPVQNLRDLPEPIQRSIPQVAVGGYIYSKNAADRLLLIDKVLRREGEEVAPDLMLEKLNPKEAVFNFKGYRYRVPY
ncbi:MAG TPA: general secretion pathway protein GspB [Duganella sp.]|jgi:general secretion pathway protein B